MYDEVARLPQVQRSARITAYQIYGLDADGRIDQFFGAQAVTTEPSGNFIVGNPKLLSGRLPRPDAANEVLINRFLAQRHALRPGSQITMRLFRGRLPDNPALADVGASTPVTFTVVGVGVFTNDVVPTNLLFLISFRDGAEHKEGIAATDQALERTCRGVCLIERSQAPGEVVAYERVRLTPVALAGVLAALTVAALAQSLVSSIRRGRRDLAVLKALGFVPRQVLATVAWQASAVVVLAPVIGLPLGTVVGRWAWTGLAAELGVASDAGPPLLLLLLLLLATVLMANFVAAGPGRVASRLAPANVLRVE